MSRPLASSESAAGAVLEEGVLRSAEEALPQLGTKKPSKPTTWLAPHVVSMAVGVIMQHGRLPSKDCDIINELMHARRRASLRRGFFMLFLMLLCMWGVFVTDSVSGSNTINIKQGDVTYQYPGFRYILSTWPEVRVSRP